MPKPIPREDLEALVTNSLYDTDDRRNLAAWALFKAPFDALMQSCLRYGASLHGSGSLSPYAYITCADLRKSGGGVPTMKLLARRAAEYDLIALQRPKDSQRPTMIEFRTRGAVQTLRARYSGQPFLDYPALEREIPFDAWAACVDASGRGVSVAARKAAVANLAEAQRRYPNVSVPEFALLYARHRLNELNFDPNLMEL